MRYHLGFAGPPGQRVFVSLIAPERPSALALVVHGAGSYLGPYLPFGWELAAAGAAVALMDLPGHGLSDGPPAHIRSFRQYLTAIREALTWARTYYPALPAFLVGESYGAVLAFLCAVEWNSAPPAAPHSLAGLALSAPAFRVAGVPAAALAAVQVVARVIPRLRLPRGTAVAVTHNPVAGEIVRRDPLLCRRLSAAYVAQLVRAGQEAMGKASRLHLPALFLISRGDAVVDNEASREVFSRLPGDRRTWHEFSGLGHALLLDDPTGMAALVSRWMHGQPASPPEAVAGCRPTP